ncbi:MAG: universal stress protein [Flavobacterium sp.]|jgi:nucleotide-binding universal stress UspA family protein|uniref:universal stress protein n=1 Tax=Flavobacterium sp. TaxID=239 RepID=UPI0029745CC3|nr:universal stress protein [Flavobacterium sp.]TAF12043.1 MAG: universal stress protein [Flavobacteriia bacterium]WRH72073.1 MAG: universal stress protein [Flavobacterium sp.]
MKRILVPTDFSKHAEYALKVAAQIAKKSGGEIFLVHMLELPTSGNDAMSTAHEIPELMLFKNAAINKLDTIMSAEYLSGVNISKIIQFEMAFDGIIKNGKAHNVDLIVMGSHGASGFQEMFIGSNTEKVVRNSDVPVLVIKREESDFNANNFVFASDFSEEIKKPFEKVVEFADKFNSHLHLVTVNTPNNFKSTRVAQKAMDEFVAEFKINNCSTHIYNDVNVEKGILHFAKGINADIIGMSTHGRKGLSHFFNGSISEDLVNHAKRPVITFKI